MYNANEFWDKIFEKLKILKHLEKEEYFVLSRLDCSMVFSNEFKIRLEDYFVFKSKASLPKIFRDNNLVLLQKFKSTFSICFADNYYKLPRMDYEPSEYKETINVLSIQSNSKDHISFGLSLLNSGIFEDVLVSFEGKGINLKEVYSYRSVLSDSGDIKPVYKSKKTFQTTLMRVGQVKLFYDFIMEDSNNLYCVSIHDHYTKTLNKSILYNFLHTFNSYTSKKINFTVKSV